MPGMSQHVYSMPNVGHRRRRVSVEDAARILGISENAVRKRIERGTLDSERDGDTRYVLLDGDVPRHATDIPKHANGMSDSMPNDIALMQSHLDSQKEQIEFLRRELERKDALLLNMTETLKALSPLAHDAPSGERESSSEAPKESTDTQPRTEEPERETESSPPSWWRRWFGTL